MASAFYNAGKVHLWDGTIGLVNDTIKFALVTSTYVPNFDTHDYFNDITGESSGTGYTAGGYTMASKTVTQDNTNDRAVFDAADISSATTTVTFRYGIIYKDTGSAATSPLICLIDFNTDKSFSAETLYIQFATGGIFYY